ncbi:hypothetical protein [Zooshikella harenae]|uniref:Uncharacterized protein n=1 Tax=Zooshikella harenae TaxID=2827238 RepID=A0ABS5ZJX6_9GAMM|nr:hypothetical protein [Zooshikella harenae]MBU2713292.1 hypothetical protein [Zooshikella harenae]
MILFIVLLILNIYLHYLPISHFAETPQHPPPKGEVYIPYCLNDELSLMTTNKTDDPGCLADHPGEFAKIFIFIGSLFLLIIFPIVFACIALVYNVIRRILKNKHNLDTLNE